MTDAVEEHDGQAISYPQFANDIGSLAEEEQDQKPYLKVWTKPAQSMLWKSVLITMLMASKGR